MNYKVSINITANSTDEARQIAALLQQTINNVDNNDIIKLLTKVADSPKVVDRKSTRLNSSHL